MSARSLPRVHHTYYLTRERKGRDEGRRGGGGGARTEERQGRLPFRFELLLHTSVSLPHNTSSTSPPDPATSPIVWCEAALDTPLQQRAHLVT